MSQSIRLDERINSIDTIRGVALLGLLTMNLVGMAMPFGAYLQPLAYRADDMLNLPIFSIFFVFSDQKFMGMFSLLFGASVMLLIERLQSKGEPSLGVHYRRNIILIVMGLAHGAYLWEGDVLLIYGFCALFLYPLHRCSPWVLTLFAVVLLAASAYSAGNFAGSIVDYSVDELYELRQLFNPSAESIADDKQLYSLSYQEIVAARWSIDEEIDVALMQFDVMMLMSSLYRAMGMMCLGMALYKWRYLHGQLPMALYKYGVSAGLLIGLPLAFWAWFAGVNSHWSIEGYLDHWGVLPVNTLASVFLVLAYISGIALLCRIQWAPYVQKRFQAVGQTALSNYLLQSLIGTTLMYGYGLGLWGELARWQLVMIMLMIWGLQLWLAPWWLRYFRQGPVEYIWRCLTYFSLPPLRK
ncbi:DUF418 domain-containing protein [Pseudoteredinibacter isoporae]|uniref:DUF418 domain-containing protein n=1 Tax=Pseudoteredinibacter isoporae TaxID=570281 RepID=UPI003102018B